MASSLVMSEFQAQPRVGQLHAFFTVRTFSASSWVLVFFKVKVTLPAASVTPLTPPSWPAVFATSSAEPSALSQFERFSAGVWLMFSQTVVPAGTGVVPLASVTT